MKNYPQIKAFCNVNLSNLENVLQRNLRTDRAWECIFRGSGGANFLAQHKPGGTLVGSMYVLLCPRKLWISHCRRKLTRIREILFETNEEVELCETKKMHP